MSLDIYTAIELGNMQAVYEAIRQNPNALKQPKGLYPSPLHKAFAEGKTKIAKALVQYVGQITPEIVAKTTCLKKPYPTRPINEIRYKFDCLMTCAILGDSPELVDVCLQNGYPLYGRYLTSETFFIEACKRGKLETVKHFVEDLHSFLYQVDDHNLTGLHHVAQAGHTPIVNYLLQQGMNPIVYSKKACSPLHFAANAEIAAALIQAGVPVNDTNEMGQTPLHLAAAEDNLELFLLLVGNNAALHLRDGGGDTPIDIVTGRSYGRLYNHYVRQNIKDWMDQHPDWEYQSKDFFATPIKVTPYPHVPQIPPQNMFQDNQYYLGNS